MVENWIEEYNKIIDGSDIELDAKRLKNYARVYARYYNMQHLLIHKWQGKRIRDFTEEEWEKVVDGIVEQGNKGIERLKKILTDTEYTQMLRYYDQAQERKKKSGFVYHRGGRHGGVYRRG